MLIKTILEMFFKIIELFLNVVPGLPQFPVEVTEVLNNITYTLKSSVQFVNIFFPLKYAILLATMSLLVKNWKLIYKMTMYVVRKVPFININ